MPVAKMVAKYIDSVCLQDHMVLRKDKDQLLSKRKEGRKEKEWKKKRKKKG